MQSSIVDLSELDEPTEPKPRLTGGAALRPEKPVVASVEQTALAIRGIDEELRTKASEQLLGVLAWDSLAPDQEGPTEEDVSNLGEAEAWRRFRRAAAGLLPKSQAPMGVHVAQALVQTAQRAEDKSRRSVVRPSIAIMVPPPHPIETTSRYDIVDVTEVTDE